MQLTPISTPEAGHPLLIVAPKPEAVQVTEADRADVLSFLLRRPLNCSYLLGLILDNGLSSSLNRGSFYVCRNNLREIQGVALIGHATIIECINDEAVSSFAEIAARNTLHMIMCEERFGNRFRADYSLMGQTVRLAHRELLFELRWPLHTAGNNYQLRLATAADIDRLEPVHAIMALNESGVDPRVVDENGFRERYLRRIHQGRTWILMEGKQLIFKADVVTETAHASYIEGIWVNPDYRRKGYGRNCMSQLARMLLWRSRSLCLFVNDENKEAQSFYRLCGYHPRAAYDAMFLQ